MDDGHDYLRDVSGKSVIKDSRCGAAGRSAAEASIASTMTSSSLSSSSSGDGGGLTNVSPSFRINSLSTERYMFSCLKNNAVISVFGDGTTARHCS